MIAEVDRPIQEYRVVSDQRQDFVHGRAKLNALRYKDVRWIVLAPPTAVLNHRRGKQAVVEFEKYGTMLIPHSFVISLLLLVADSIPDFASPSALDVNELIARAQRGDRDAVAALYRVYAQAIYRYVVMRVPTDADAEDLTAEVFVSMVKGLPGYQLTGAPFDAWLYRIAASRISDFYRQASRREHHELTEALLDSGPQPEEQVLQRQAIEHLRSVLQQLPEDYQTILILRFVERKSHDEVAELLGRTVSAVKSAQYRALKRLTTLLGNDHKVRHYLRGNRDG